MFNSIHQLKKFGPQWEEVWEKVWAFASIRSASTQEGHAIYDPCAPAAAWG